MARPPHELAGRPPRDLWRRGIRQESPAPSLGSSPKRCPAQRPSSERSYPNRARPARSSSTMRMPPLTRPSCFISSTSPLRMLARCSSRAAWHPHIGPCACPISRAACVPSPRSLLKPAEDDLLQALLARLLSDRQLLLPESLQVWMLTRLPRHPAALREAVARLDRQTLAEGRRVTRAGAAAGTR